MGNATEGLLTLSILGSAVVYGTDVFCAMVLRPTLSKVSDETVLEVMGTMHGIADKRMPVPGAIGWVASALATVAALIDGQQRVALLSAIAFAALAIWMVIYVRVSAPINKRLTAAVGAGASAGIDPRALQQRWDSVITARAGLQTVALLTLCLALADAH
ncbi:uncharacterized protein DUF1772 [Nocardia tenerifensis]|uniref:Uncharacterized protein DUF1772 n=1 Tax=Nocardia tenerifensis TaxID=228006 RepID=A0A318KC28_9NOCA|nr:DUF1772 domain-containing protein [Nocardia tenerifensis]PXX55564.1 uncharacterized protein DUF1772 [Nocardia tenerifensis]